MASFSQRKGFKPIKVDMQIESIDDDLRNGLWNALLDVINQTPTNHDFYDQYYDENKDERARLFNSIWINYLKQTTDTKPFNVDSFLRNYFFDCEWYEVYDLIEFFVTSIPQNLKVDFTKNCNNILKKENSAYRLIDGNIVEITDKNEIKEIEEAIEKSKKTALEGVRTHLGTALSLLSNRKNPDYRNSIKESISAVESISKIISDNPKATLTSALNQIENKGKMELHASLKQGFSKLYGYTSDEHGIRHAIIDEKSTPCFEEAKYMLGSCSAFINYLIVKANKAGIKL